MTATEHKSNDLSGETVFVTGAGGYIGSRLAAALLARGANVRAFDRFFFGEETLADLTSNSGLTITKGDVRDVTARDLEGSTAVCDLAALSNDPAGNLNPELTRSINRDGRGRVAAAAREAGVSRYLLSSTCSVYGAAERGFSHEGSPTNPVSLYAQSNLEAENIVFGLAQPDFVVAALRNATVFGVSSRMRFDLVVNLMTLHAFEHGRITVMGGGKQWRPLVHVSDVANAMIALLAAPADTIQGKAFNLGVGNFQILTIAAIVREVLPFPIEIQIAPDDPDRRDYRVSFDRLRDEVGFEASVSVDEGVREIYDALKFGKIENGRKCSTVQWYQHILDAKKLVAELELHGRML